eukprot:3713192-Alexandrium_andersonii.AAC.1
MQAHGSPHTTGWWAGTTSVSNMSTCFPRSRRSRGTNWITRSPTRAASRTWGGCSAKPGATPWGVNSRASLIGFCRPTECSSTCTSPLFWRVAALAHRSSRTGWSMTGWRTAWERR